ncbi:MAG: CBS domain-containing protein [Candidatus Methanofastidiosia archaeon]
MESKLFASVKEFLTPNLLTVAGTKTLLAAAKLMSSLNIGSLIVEKDNKPLGIITERDIIKHVASENDVNKTLIKDIMTINPITIDARMTVKEALMIMARENIRHLLVEENGRLVGMFSFKNFLDLERQRVGFI